MARRFALAAVLLLLTMVSLPLAQDSGKEGEGKAPKEKPRQKGVLLGINIDTNRPGAVWVSSVSRGTPADKAGVKVGDKITKLGATEITDLASLRAVLKETEELSTHKLIVQRNGKAVSLEITFEEKRRDLTETGARGEVHAGGDKISGNKQRKKVISALPGLGVDFLLMQQKAEGRWAIGMQPSRDPARGASVGVTALVGLCLLENYDLKPKKIKASIKQAIKYIDKFAYRKERGARDFEFTAWGQLYACVLLTRLSAHKAWKKEIKTLSKLRDEILGWMYHRQMGGNWQGAWGYRDSFQTAVTILGLIEMEKAGVKIKKKVLDESAAFLEKLREGKGLTFRYSGGSPPINDSTYRAQDAAGRLGLCVLASFATGKSTLKQVRQTVELFIKHRDFMNKSRKITDPRNPGDIPYRRGSATPYCWFFHFGYFYSAQCLQHIEKKQRNAWGKQMKQDLYAAINSDGTWTAFEAVFGDNNAQPDNKVYATAMSLMALHEIDRALALKDAKEKKPEQEEGEEF